VVKLVEVCVLQIDIADLRSAFDLLARNLCGLFVLLFGDQSFEFARAYFVGALADDERALVVAGFNKINSRKERAMMFERNTRAFAFDHLRKLADVSSGRAAASADEI